MWPPAVIVHGPIPNSHVKMAFVEWNQEVETFATKVAAQSLAHRVRLGRPHWRTQNPYPQIGKTLVDVRREDTVAIVDDDDTDDRPAGLPGVAAASIPTWDGP